MIKAGPFETVMYPLGYCRKCGNGLETFHRLLSLLKSLYAVIKDKRVDAVINHSVLRSHKIVKTTSRSYFASELELYLLLHIIVNMAEESVENLETPVTILH